MRAGESTVNEQPPTESPSARRSVLKGALRMAAIVAGVFTLVVGVSMVASQIQTQRAAPLESPALKALSERLAAHPEDAALREQVRALDLLARRAFFSNQSFLRTGAGLLAGGLVVFLVSAGLLAFWSTPRPDPCRTPLPAQSPRAAARARWAVAAVGLVLALAVLAALRGRSVPLPPGSGSTPADQPTASPAKADAKEPAADFPSAAEIATNWPGFRGPTGGGLAASAAPTNWDGVTGANVLWKTATPRPGFSSPVVWGNRVYLTGADAEAREVYCFDADSGALRWRHAATDIPGSPGTLPNVGPDTGFAASTPATDGRRVVAVFATGDLVCVDPDGHRLWARHLGVPENNYGYASSLVIRRDRVFIQYDQANGARLLALSLLTGKTLWEKARDVNPSWATPLLADTGKRLELVLTANPWVISYNPDNGAEWWRVDCMGGEVGSSPAHAGGRVFTANANVRLAAIDTAKAKVAWEQAEDLPDVSSPLATCDYVFIGCSYGVINCYAAADGQRLWKQEFDAGFYASPILAGGLVYLMDQNGVMRIFKASNAYVPIGSPSLGEKCNCTPAAVAGRLYLRGEKTLFCIGGK